MKKVLLFIIISVISIACTRSGYIPRNKLSQIYAEMYVLDQFVNNSSDFRKAVDTLSIYEPIFNKYGFTFEDYDRSVNKYLKDPERFIKVFEKTEAILNERIELLTLKIIKEEELARWWSQLDNIRVKGADTTMGNGYYRSLHTIFFVPDTIDPKKQYILLDSIPINYKPKENAFNFYTILPSQAGDIFKVVKEENTNPKADDIEKKNISEPTLPNSEGRNQKRIFRDI